MLVLARKTGQQIMIGDSIVVTVVGIRAGQIRLGIDAPAHVAIHRREIYDDLAGKTDKSPAPQPRPDESASRREQSGPIK